MQTQFSAGNINIDVLFMTQSWEVESNEKNILCHVKLNPIDRKKYRD